MSEHVVTTANPRIHLIQQAIKWTVYTLLIINWNAHTARGIDVS